MIKIQQTMNIKGFLVPDKRHRNSKANFILNGQPLTFFLRPRTRQKCLLSPILLDILANAIYQETEYYRVQIEKEETKLPLFIDKILIAYKILRSLQKIRTNNRIYYICWI